ncbi:hypothetical protein [Flaviaesturariibacter aridisoli]|uniref:Uncharacterized protein n=1 Tax=Flaviaesturariibacter aridisoli TaxID=2545761 RepID=A0A4R4E6F2_9BACT|nr:hypothetical protein [Flaviaesturariibacter aridisoli]TCZ73278.1 hypothetical protein E0486_06285 [Flaviaesturariibacter aridisoli]
MKAHHLYESYPDIFQPKKLPEYLQFSDILPFFIDDGTESERPSSSARPVKVLRSRPQAETLVPVKGKTLDDMIEPGEDGIPMLTHNGQILALYLPFHFFYRPDQSEFEQWWGIWITETAIYDVLEPLLSHLPINAAQRQLLAETYIVNFGLFYHKVEMFVSRNEVFEREPLYKYHFSKLKKELLKQIDRHAHTYAALRVDQAVNKRLESIGRKERAQAATIFRELFEYGWYNEEADLLNGIYNEMHQPGRHRNKEIWTDLGHWSDAGIVSTKRDNVFIVPEIIPGRRPK